MPAMFRPSTGHAAIEFALALPVLLAVFVPAFQLFRLCLLQTRLEVLALDVARVLTTRGIPDSNLAEEAANLTASLEPPVAAEVRARTLTTLSVDPLRRARRVDVIEVDLSTEGPRLAPGAPSRVRAHAREFRWGRP
jgi:hypothetical protein